MFFVLLQYTELGMNIYPYSMGQVFQFKQRNALLSGVLSSHQTKRWKRQNEGNWRI